MGWSTRSSELGLNKQKSSLSRDLTRTILIWGNGRNGAEILRTQIKEARKLIHFIEN